MHQSTPGIFAQGGAKFLTNGFKCLVRHLHDMEMVNDHLRLWQHKADRIEVGTPHIDACQGNMIPVSLRHTRKARDDGRFVAVAHQINDAVIADVRDHATRFVQQVNLVNAQRRAGRGVWHTLVRGEMRAVFGKDAADGSFVNAYVIGNAGEGMSERLFC